MPVALKDMDADEFVALLLMLIPPVAVPTDAGANVTMTVVVVPTFRMSPFEIPDSVKPAPEIVTLVKVTDAAPVLLIMKLWLRLLPTFTLPKL